MNLTRLWGLVMGRTGRWRMHEGGVVGFFCWSDGNRVRHRARRSGWIAEWMGTGFGGVRLLKHPSASRWSGSGMRVFPKIYNTPSCSSRAPVLLPNR